MSLKINLIGVKISLHDKVFGMIGNEAVLGMVVMFEDELCIRVESYGRVLFYIVEYIEKQALDNLKFWNRGG